MPAWLRDSKMLSEARREEIFDAVGAWCQAWSVGHASPAECDDWGMTEALRVAARRALAGLGQAPRPSSSTVPSTCCATPTTPSTGAVRPIVDGDAKCASVAAASVLAKVVRDRIMREEADHFPAYAFERNKGYPSPVHQTALRGYGPTAIHRRSWAFVRGPPVVRAGPGLPVQTTAATSAKWQATGWPWPRSTRAGSSVAQISCAFQHRVRKRQPEGGDCGLGTSPSSTMCLRARSALGSGMGTADRSAWV